MSKMHKAAYSLNRVSIDYKLLAGLVVLAGIVWFGRHAGAELVAMEGWIAGHGILGILVFVGLIVVFTSLFVPDTLFAIAAGALFGLAQGTALILVGATIAALLDFCLARKLLRPRILALLQRRPKLQAIERVANKGGLRLQLLLRLAPISPVTVSYLAGASNTRFSSFLGAIPGMIPGLFCEVYFGYMAMHLGKVAGNVSEHSMTHTVVTVSGFLVCLALMVYISRLVVAALAEAGDVAG